MATPSTRPELACEIVPEGVIAARRQFGAQALAAASFVAFGPGAPAGMFAPYLDKEAPRVGLPGVQTGNSAERDAVVAAMRRALENVGGRSGVLTLVVPDTAVRVLVLDFDSLPAKASDAIPLLRFRLKKMVPFDVDDAQISYQPLSAASGARALVAIMSSPVLREYEAVVRESGFEPGIVLPSALACLGMVNGGPALLIHSNSQSVTAAIVNGEQLLLHRTQELPWSREKLAQTMNPAAGEAQPEEKSAASASPSVAEAEILPQATELENGLPEENLFPALEPGAEEGPQVFRGVPAEDSFAAPFAQEPAADAFDDVNAAVPPVDAGERDAVHEEMQHALAVAVAYFEDTVGRPPHPVLVAGAVDARAWQAIFADENVTLQDLVGLENLGTAASAGLSRAQLGAVCGALRG